MSLVSGRLVVDDSRLCGVGKSKMIRLSLRDFELYALLQDEETTWRQQISCFLYPIPPVFSCFPLSYTPPCWKYCRQTESSGILASFLQRQRLRRRSFSSRKSLSCCKDPAETTTHVCAASRCVTRSDAFPYGVARKPGVPRSKRLALLIATW